MAESANTGQKLGSCCKGWEFANLQNRGDMPKGKFGQTLNLIAGDSPMQIGRFNGFVKKSGEFITRNYRK